MRWDAGLPGCTGSSAPTPCALTRTRWAPRRDARADSRAASRSGRGPESALGPPARHDAQRCRHPAKPHLLAYAIAPELGRFDQLDPSCAAHIDELNDQLL